MKQGYRQGDVGLIKISKIVGKKLKHLVLAVGEVTGHKHEVIDNAELYDHEGTLFLKVNETTELTHQEHQTITLPKGDYEVRRQREYEPNGWRQVSD